MTEVINDDSGVQQAPTQASPVQGEAFQEQTKSSTFAAPENTQKQAEPTPHQKFLDTLPEAYRADPMFRNFNSLDDLAKSYQSAAKLVGLDKEQLLRFPKDDAPEAWGEVWNKLGRPETPEGYSKDAFTEDFLPEGRPQELATFLHEIGVTGKQYEAIGKFYRGVVEKDQAAQEQALSASVEKWQSEIKQEFGSAYEERIGLARKAMTLGGEELEGFIAEAPEIFEHPAFIKFMSRVGGLLSQTKEDPGFVTPGGRNTGRLTPNEAKAELAAFQADKANVSGMMDPRNPQRQFLIEKRQKLFEMAYPDGAM